MEDFGIIDLYWQRNQNAIKETDLKYGNYLYTISINILRNKEDTEECLNDTYFKAWNNIPPQIPTTFRVYLGKIIRNTSFDCNKKKNSKNAKQTIFQFYYQSSKNAFRLIQTLKKNLKIRK